MLQHFLCAVLLHHIPHISGSTSTKIWFPVYVNQIFLEIESDLMKNLSFDSELSCAMFASSQHWAHLFCFEEERCLLTELLRGPSENVTRMEATVKCMTHFRDGDFPCGHVSNIGYKGYGCIFKNEKVMPWEEARSYCQSLGMDLVSNKHLKTAAHRQSIREELGLNGTEKFWVGAHKRDPTVNQFWWVTGKVLPEEDERWGLHQPHYWSRNKNELYVIEIGGGLYDVNADYSFMPMCGL